MEIPIKVIIENKNLVMTEMDKDLLERICDMVEGNGCCMAMNCCECIFDSMDNFNSLREFLM